MLSLNRERLMVQWYLDRDLPVQAVALAREWLVSWVVVQAKLGDLYDKDIREEAERALSGANRQRSQNSGAFDDVTFFSGKTLKGMPWHATALSLFEQLANVRNTLLHAGKRPNLPPADTLERQVRDLCGQLNALPLVDDLEQET